jgi:hypothetical protein
VLGSRITEVRELTENLGFASVALVSAQKMPVTTSTAEAAETG